jgi:hypothetical protein
VNRCPAGTNAIGSQEQWTPIILASQEAEIRKITVWDQPGQKVKETPLQSINQV